MAVQDPITGIGRSEPPLAPPGLPLLEALRRNLGVFLLPVVLLVALGVLAGLLRNPTYTSESRLNVGGLDLTQESIPGYTNAVQQLAIAYARAITAAQVVDPVARQLNLSPDTVVRNVAATPIQGSPVITIDATSADATQAQRLADAAADSLVRYAVQLNSGSDAGRQLLAKYLAASRALQRANSILFASPRGTPRHDAAQTQVDVARLQLQTNGFLYQQSQLGLATENLVQKLAPAGPATSDRGSVLQQYAGAGLVAGLLIGLGLVVYRGNQITRRRLRSE